MSTIMDQDQMLLLPNSMKMELDTLNSTDDDFWLFDDDMINKYDIYSALPLSAIQNNPYDISIDCVQDEHISNSLFSDLEQNEEKPIKPSRAELANKLLIKLEEPKQEPFTDWFEEKIELPVFDEYAQVRESTQDTQSLLLEFESVCGVVGVHPVPQFNQLTPPQSPPQQQHQQLQQNGGFAHQQHQQPQPELTQLDVAQEIAYVDELVKTRAQSFGWSDKSGPIINADNYFENARNSFDHEYSKNHIDIEPDSPKSSSCSSSSSSYGSSEIDEDWSYDSSKKSKGRPKPYGRNVDDKRSRKKEQNKNAATRYRQKKKAEVEVLAGEEKLLEDKNNELKSKVSELKWEVKYLRGLMRDIYRAKGLIK